MRKGMKKLLLVALLAAFVSSGCVPPGQVKKETAPGQVQKETGYNPASGKVKIKDK
jgi:hypothetical protein